MYREMYSFYILSIFLLDTPRLLHADIRFALSVVLHALNPQMKQTSQSNAKSCSHQLNIGEQGQSDSFNQPDKYSTKQGCFELQEQTAYLGQSL